MVEIKLDSAIPMCFPLSCDIPVPTLILCLPMVLSWMTSLVSSQARQECGAKAMRNTSIFVLGIYLAHFSVALNDFSGITAMEQSLEL